MAEARRVVRQSVHYPHPLSFVAQQASGSSEVDFGVNGYHLIATQWGLLGKSLVTLQLTLTHPLQALGNTRRR